MLGVGSISNQRDPGGENPQLKNPYTNVERTAESGLLRIGHLFSGNRLPLAHSSVLQVIGQDIASIQWPLVAFMAMRKLCVLLKKWSH
jgi:hypothetical protein